MNSDSPGNIPRPSLPATFELVGQDSHGSAVIKYGFKLKQWFVTRGEYNYYGYFNSLSWCRSIGYQMPRVRDFTNSQCIGVMGGSGCEGSVGTTPSSSSNHYQRNINAGFLTEWGNLLNYPGASCTDDHWTSDATPDSERFDRFIVWIGTGEIYRYRSRDSSQTFCASVLKP
ncbi:hypothetical protein A9G41_10705 [Gilliamella sp. Nev5-1]|nr:hypothetical protein A9G40_11830 [Gilliamella apicola]OCG67348.1 hypothetical protein A9G41_10705 [Gilliamella apicola]